jgi:hypothetical protein
LDFFSPQLIPLIEIIISVKPVVILFLLSVPDITVPPVESQISVICGLLRAYVKPRAIY